GIILTDTTGGSSNLIVSSSSNSTVASDLGIATNAASAQVNSGAFDRQSLSEANLLSTVKGGQGVTTLGDINITDSSGVKRTIDHDTPANKATTVGDVISRITSAAIGVEARINDTGDGILLVDTADGPGKLKVEDASGTVAADLNLAGESVVVEVNGTET